MGGITWHQKVNYFDVNVPTVGIRENVRHSNTPTGACPCVCVECCRDLTFGLNSVRLAANETNLGFFSDQIQY